MVVPQACIFDLDGVIVDTAKYHYLAWKQLADSLEIPFDKEFNEQLKGISRMGSLEAILKSGGRTLDQSEKENLATQKNEWFINYLNKMDEREILPGVVDFLDDLDRHAIPKGIGSASKNARFALEKIGLIDRFDVIVDGNMVKNPKPDPEVFLKAQVSLETPANECIVFEDGAAGVTAAHKGNMICIGIGSTESLHEAEFVIKNFEGWSWLSIKEKLKNL